MTREDMWEEFESQLISEVRTPITMSYNDSIRIAERGIKEVVNRWKKRLEQEPCEDEYIKVPKKALKYRTAGMVAYNVEWLKNHFDIERTVLCGTQEQSGDLISKQAAIEMAYDMSEIDGEHFTAPCMVVDVEDIQKLPSVNPQEPKTDVLDKIRAEIEQTTSRYTISRERGAMGQVEWSDRLIKESEILEILDKYKAESEEISDTNLKMWQEIFKAKRSEKE